MRISYLAATALAVCLLPLSTLAYAGCNSANCATSGNTMTYGSGSYSASSASSSSSNYKSNAHANQGISTRFGTAITAACPSGATRTSNGYCTSAGSNSYLSASRNTSFASGSAYGTSSHTSGSHASGSNASGQIVPFTTTINKISNYRVAGMARNEFLSPTTCPTNVYNPEGVKVLGCYSVVKPVQAVRPVQVVRPVQQIRYQHVRVVRPIIYVRYPVHLPMPAPVCRTQTVCNSGCNNSTTYSRYAYTWPRYGNNCSGW